MSADHTAETACPICGVVDNHEIPGRHLCSGMRPVPDEDRQDFDRETRERLLARLDEFDRCRNRAAVEARFHVIG